MNIIGVSLGILGIVIGFVVAWYFYRKEKLYSERMEKNILRAIFGQVERQVSVDELFQKYYPEIDLQEIYLEDRPSIFNEMKSPDDIIKRILIQYDEGEIYWSELGIVGDSLINAGKSIAGLVEEKGRAQSLRLHGKVTDALDVEESIEKTIRQFVYE